MPQLGQELYWQAGTRIKLTSLTTQQMQTKNTIIKDHHFMQVDAETLIFFASLDLSILADLDRLVRLIHSSRRKYSRLILCNASVST
jgi:hypothetical protein